MKFFCIEEQAVPVLIELRDRLEEIHKEAFPKSKFSLSLGYNLNSWERLNYYLEDGRYEIGNNRVENAIRPVAIGRQNYLFAGSRYAARRAAIIYLLLNTWKKNNIEPRKLLQDILNRITENPVNQLENLIPDNWTVK